MARLWSCGFELGTMTTSVEVTNLGGAMTSESSVVRSGTYSAKVTGMSSTVTMGFSQDFVTPANNGPFYCRAYFRFATLPTAENRFLSFVNGATFVAGFTLDSGALVRLYDEDGVVGSASSALTVDTWYRIEMLFDGTPSAGSDVVRGYIDGSEFAGSATRSISTGITAFRCGGNLAGEAQTQGVWYFDDLAVNDSSGPQNGIPGAGSILHTHPDGAGDAAATTGTYTDVDEVTPDDDTTYIQVDTAIAANYAFQAWPGDALDTITLVQIGHRNRLESGAATNSWTVHVKTQSGGTATTGATVTQNDLTWRTNGDAVPRNYPCTAYVDPQGGGAWTPTLVGNIIAGVTVTDPDTEPDLFISTLWALVEYVPAPAAPFGVHAPYPGMYPLARRR